MNLESQLAQIRDNSTGNYWETMADMYAYAQAYAQANGGGQPQADYANVLADVVMNGMNGEFQPSRMGTPTANEIAQTRAAAQGVNPVNTTNTAALEAAAKYQRDGKNRTR